MSTSSNAALAPTSTPGIEVRVRWTEAERQSVAKAFLNIRAKNAGNPDITDRDALDAAQQSLPENRRRDFSKYNKGNWKVVVNDLLDFYVGKSNDKIPLDPPVMAALKRLRAASSTRTVKVGTEFPIIPVGEDPVPDNYQAPPKREVPKPATMTLGPLELALQQMVGAAVNDQVGKLVQAMREEMSETREQFQHLLAEQYDAIMCYWDDKYRERARARAEYVPDLNGEVPVLSQVRVRQTKVLVSGGQTDQFHNLRMHFKNVDFTFIDGREPRKVGAGGFYDLVICTKYTNHPARDTLIRLHGNKVVMVDGAITNVIAAVKKGLNL